MVLADSCTNPDNLMAPLQAAASTHRVAHGPRAGQKVLSLQLAPPPGSQRPSQPGTLRQRAWFQPARRGALRGR